MAMIAVQVTAVLRTTRLPTVSSCRTRTARAYISTFASLGAASLSVTPVPPYTMTVLTSEGPNVRTLLPGQCAFSGEDEEAGTTLTTSLKESTPFQAFGSRIRLFCLPMATSTLVFLEFTSSAGRRRC